ncbi:hypothetical protein [Streptomyces sp. GbtcB6]|uniref:hypothetical protein n=1 Tax=Streptomyces sp. GbtcB6 TaxID=2824751 RepID=UPI001C305213|nr:hypothetical protein [Streptomyces sp. GbtcB6]
MTRETPGAAVGDDEHRTYGRVPLTEGPTAEGPLTAVPTGRHPAAEVTARPTRSGRADGSTAIAYDTPDHVPAEYGRPLRRPLLCPPLHPPLHLLTHDGGS